MTSAASITAAVATPRAAFVDYPLGHTSGKPNDRDDQLAVVRGALALLDTATVPGSIVDLGRSWSADDSWKQSPLSSGSDGSSDGRVSRSLEPNYQTEQDRRLAEAAHTPPASCNRCIGVAGHP